MKSKKIKKILGLSIATSLLLVSFTGCNSKVMQSKSNSLEKLNSEEMRDNSALKQISGEVNKITRKNIYLTDKKKLSQALNELGVLDKRTYILNDKDMDIGGFPNLKFSDFFELNKILMSVYSVEMKVEQNSLDANLPKMIKLAPKEKTTVLDELRINQNGVLIPSSLLYTISSHTGGWKITYSDDLKNDLSKTEYQHFQGTVREFLDFFAQSNNYYLDFDYANKTISLAKFKSKIFRFKGAKEKYVYKNTVGVDMSVGNNSSSGGSGGSSNNNDNSGVEVTDTYDLITNLKESLKTIITNQNENEYFNIIPESGHIVVSTSYKKMQKIEKIINSINDDSFKNIYIKVTLLQTKLKNSHQRGVNWGYVKQKLDEDGNVIGLAQGAINGKLTELTSTIDDGAFFKFRGTNGLSAIVQALNEFGDTGIAYQVSATTTNNVPATMNIANVQDYIYRTEIDNSSDTPTISAEQNEVEGGKFLYVKPSVYDDEIRISLSILDRQINPFEKHEFQNSGYLQSKNLDKKLMSYNLTLKTGEKIIIGGFMEKTMNSQYGGLANKPEFSLSELFGVKGQDFKSDELALMLEVIEI